MTTVDNRTPRRKALLIGVKITAKLDTFPSIAGAHRDTELLRQLLIGVYKFRPEDTLALIDDPDFSPEGRERRWPTKRNIVRAMRELVEGTANDDTVVFHFSGHGGQIEALEDPDEVDHLDEILFPMDAMCTPRGGDARIPYMKYIKDDLIRNIFGQLPQDPEACSSSTVVTREMQQICPT
ncbi:hypothetical protein BV20DRAFT_622638 [Pilatotrama ljubarskyi]|nr:hypothetical protein BV20DRAFT_622638 [Pilatotrama ljubarskyi]